MLKSKKVILSVVVSISAIAIILFCNLYGTHRYNAGYSVGYDEGYSSGYTEGVSNTKIKYSTPTYAKSVTVYITTSGEKYHEKGCSYLSKSAIAVNLNDAKEEGYTPCSRCHPPK